MQKGDDIMAWQNLPEYVPTLEATTVNQAYDNIDYLRDAMISQGKTVDVLSPVHAEHSTPISEVVNILTNMEEDITILDEQVPSAFYVEPWEVSSSFTRENYKRWIMVMNDIYDIIINGKANWGRLRLSDGYPIIDGKRILMRGD